MSRRDLDAAQSRRWYSALRVGAWHPSRMMQVAVPNSPKRHGKPNPKHNVYAALFLVAVFLATMVRPHTCGVVLGKSAIFDSEYVT